jgi:RimJ/RimL family protein N-acetyltransferase
VRTPDSLTFLRAALDPVRLAVLGASVAGPVSLQAIADDLDVPPRSVAEAVGALRAAGILGEDGTLDVAVLREIAKDLPADGGTLGTPVDGPWTEREAAVLGRFFDGDRLVQIPQAAGKRRLVMERIAIGFEPGRRYRERDVNFMIQLIHPDYAAVRRYLVEEGFMDRADGAYWRTGGRYEAPTEPATGQAPRGEVIEVTMPGVELRSYDSSMVESLVAAANDERIPRFMGDGFASPYTNAAAEAWIEMASSEPSMQFAVFVDGTLRGGMGGFVGTGETTGTAEIGWWLNPEVWGRGIATAAAIAMVDVFFGRRGLMRLWAPVMAGNHASARVAEKIGMRQEGVAPSTYLKGGVRYDQINYGLTRSQWLAGR